MLRLSSRPHHFPDRSVDLLLNPPNGQRLDRRLGHARSRGSTDPEFPMPGIAPDLEQRKFHTAVRHVRSSILPDPRLRIRLTGSDGLGCSKMNRSAHNGCRTPLFRRLQLAAPDPPRSPVGFERIAGFAVLAIERAPSLAAGRQHENQGGPALGACRQFNLSHGVNLPSDLSVRPFQMNTVGKNNSAHLYACNGRRFLRASKSGSISDCSFPATGHAWPSGSRRWFVARRLRCLDAIVLGIGGRRALIVLFGVPLVGFVMADDASGNHADLAMPSHMAGDAADDRAFDAP